MEQIVPVCGGRQQEHPSLPPDMYETSESTSASASWSTSGSRRVSSKPQKYQQTKRNGYSHGGGQYTQSHYQNHQHRRADGGSVPFSARVPSTGFQGGASSQYRGRSGGQSSNTSSPGAVPRTQAGYHSQEQSAVIDGGHVWTHAPPQSQHASRHRPVGYRQDYSRSQHAGIREADPRHGYNYRQQHGPDAVQRDKAHSPVSEPNFPTSSSRLSAYTSRHEYQDSRQTPPPPDNTSNRSEENSHSPSISERIQKFNAHAYSYHEVPSYHYEGQQQPPQQMYMEQQQQMYPPMQPQEPQAPLTPNGQSRARALVQRYESEGHPPQDRRPYGSPPPPELPPLGVGGGHRHRATSDAEDHYQDSRTMPRRHLNHGMGGDVHPSRGRTRHQDPMKQSELDHYQYETQHRGREQGNMHYDIPHNGPPSRNTSAEDIQNHYSLDDTIETPSVSSVTELRRRLWDDEESLQVAVKPSLQQHGDARKHWMLYYGPEMAGRSGQRTNDGMDHPPPRQPHHPPPTQPRPGQRMTRSLSPARPQYRSRKEQSQTYSPPLSQQQRHETSSTSGIEPDREQGTMFKSRFYRAAVAARRGGKELRSKSPPSSRSNTVSEGRKHWSNPNSPQPQSMPDPARAPAPPPSRRESPPGEQQHYVGEQNEGIERVYSSDPTSGGNSEGSSVARLVAQLNAVNRKNPEAALQKIDSILRAESRSSSGGAGGASPSSPQNSPGDEGRLQQYLQENSPPSDHRQHQTQEERPQEESSDDESDDETSVSSITNPTYMSGKHANDREQPGSVPNLSTSVNRRPRPNALQMYGHQPVPYHEPVRGKSSSRKKGPRSPPPETIKVENKVSAVLSPSNKGEDESNTNNATLHSSTATPQPSLKGPQPKDQKSAASIALKIRMWDDMSNPSISEANPPHAPSSNSSRASESNLSTVNTDDLGSIMTPADAAVSAVNRRAHPWDDHIPQEPKKMDTSGDMFDVNPALLQSFSDKEENKKNTQNMSEKFDEAWVSLPSNAFFAEATSSANGVHHQPYRPRRTTEEHNTFRAQPRSTQPPLEQFPTETSRPANNRTFGGNVSPSVSDAFAGKEDLLPGGEASDVGSPTPQARRNKLLLKLRKNKGNPSSPMSPKPLPAVFPGGSPTRTNKPLLSEYARDSVDETNSSHKRRKSKSPGRARIGSSDGAPRRGSFWRRGS